LGTWSTIAGLVEMLAVAIQQPVPSHDQQTPPRESARELLERAADVQGWPACSPPQAPKEGEAFSLHVEMLLEHRDDKGNDVQLEVERRFLEPSFLWTRLRDIFTGTETFEGFDGTAAWYRRKDRTTLLEGPEFAEDRLRLVREIDETRLLGRLFFLKNLLREIQHLQRLSDEQRAGRAVAMIAGDGRHARSGEEPQLVALRLAVELQSHHLVEATITRPELQEPPLRLVFSQHFRGKDGVLHPGRIELFRGDEKKPSQTIYVGRIQFGSALKPADFAPPR